MHILGTCAFCSRTFGVNFDLSLSGANEGKAKYDDSSVELAVSLGVVLRVIGYQITGFRSSEVLDLVKAGSGLNVNEYLGSRICPACFPDQKSSGTNYTNIDNEPDDDDYEDDFTEYDDNGEPIQQPVRALKVGASGLTSVIHVDGFGTLADNLSLDREDLDYTYIRDLGVFVYFDDQATQRNADLNCYISVIVGGPIHGDVVIVSDIDEYNSRSSLWRDLRDDWFSSQLLDTVKIINSDPDAKMNFARIRNSEH